MALFVSFEGIDGCGKTTQARLLADALTGEGREVVATREPGGTPLGERIRELLLAGDDMAPWAEAALFAAARAELVAHVIRPALAGGRDVVCDRYVDSSLAYQGVARGLGVDAVLDLNRPAVDGLLPDRTFLLVLDPAVALARRAPGDRIEQAGLSERLEEAYREVAARFPERIEVIDGSLAPDEIARRVRGALAAQEPAR